MVSRYKNNLRIADHKAVLATQLFLFAAFYLSYSNCILRLNETAVDPERNINITYLVVRNVCPPHT